jgi:hypothetical protein
MTSRWATRLKHSAAFVAIVWGVALTFVGFDLLALMGVDLAIANRDLTGNMMMSSATAQSKSCIVQPEETAGASGILQGQNATDLQTRAWLLGLGLGRDAVIRQYTPPESQGLAEFKTILDQVAGDLGVPAPGVFVPEYIANANTEFVVFVETDNQGTAHRLAVNYAPRVCQIYKLGALWGYSSVVRGALAGERAVFSLEIQHYARETGVPDPLWRPMLERTPAEATPSELQSDTASLTEGVTKYFSGS